MRIASDRWTAEQLEALREGRQDVGFIHLAAEPPTGLQTRDLMSEVLHLAVPANRFLAQHDEVLDLADAADECFVLFPRHLEPATHDLITGACRTNGFEPYVVQEATGLHTLLGLVAAGIGCAFVLEDVAARAATPGVVFRPIKDSPEVTTAVAWREPRTNAAVETLLRLTIAGGSDTAG